MADNVASTAPYSSVFIGAVIIIGSLIFLKPILRLLGATESILPYAVTYAGICVLFSIFNAFNVTMNNLVTSEGAAKTTMCALLTGAVLNIILDPIFIYILNLGVAGAAIATAISQIVSTAVYLHYILSKKSVFHFKIRDCCFSEKIMSEILKIGIPTLVFQLLTGLSITLINLEAIRISLIWSTIFCVIFGLTAALFPTAIISQFTSGDAEMIAVGQRTLRANGLSFLLFGFYTVYSSLFLALEKAKEGFILGACKQGLCFVPVILILPAVFGISGILYAQPASDVISAVITVLMAVSLHKKL